MCVCVKYRTPQYTFTLRKHSRLTANQTERKKYALPAIRVDVLCGGGASARAERASKRKHTTPNQREI